jgi:hypothetical protein
MNKVMRKHDFVVSFRMNIISLNMSGSLGDGLN